MADGGLSSEGTAENASKASEEEEMEDEDVFEVEKIMGMIKVKGKTLFKVRWVGYGPDHDTFEPYENLDSCQEMVDEYIRKQKERQAAPRKDPHRGARKKSPPVAYHDSYHAQHPAEPPSHPDPALDAPGSSRQDANKRASHRATTWKYVSNDDAEYDTLKDKFWRDLDQGRINVFESGDMYSKVKASGRASRPQSFTEMFQNKPLTAPSDKSSDKSSKRGKGKSSSGKTKGKSRNRRSSKASTPDGNVTIKKEVTEVSAAKVKRERVPSMDCSSVDSRASFEAASSVGTSLSQVSEDSNHSYHVEVKEEIVGILPMSNRPTTPMDTEDSIQMPEYSQPHSMENYSPMSTATSTTTPLTPEPSVSPSTASRVPTTSQSPVNTCPTATTTATTATVCSTASSQSQDSAPTVTTTANRDSDYDQVEVVELDSVNAYERHRQRVSSPYNSALDSVSSARDTSLYSGSPTDSGRDGPSSVDSALPHSDITPVSIPSAFDSSPDFFSSLPGYGNIGHSHQQLGFGSNNNTHSSFGGHSGMSGGSSTATSTATSSSAGNDDKHTLNNNKGETGDEEYEFDWEDVDPEWEGKNLPKISLPEVLELTNAEIRQLVKCNDYARLVRALRAKKTYDLEQPDQQGITLAMLAAQNGFDDILELLSTHNVNINNEQKNGNTPLLLACDQGLRCTVSLLLAMGARMNHHNQSGETPLIKAVKRGHKHIVKQLLEQGANFSSPYSLDTPMKWAKYHRDISDLLNTHIARLKTEFEHQVNITLNNTARTSSPLFPLQCFALREADKCRVLFKNELEPTKPGVGMLLFISHCRLSGQEVRCRFYGPCAVTSVLLNGVKLTPLTEEGNFVMSFCPLHNGRNELEINTVKAPLSKAKLIVCAYKTTLI